jgi:hypothetical protein
MQITLTMDEFDELRRGREQAEQELKRFRDQARIARQVDDVAILCDALRASIPIVQFAVANLSPTFQRNWPTAKLRTSANAVSVSPVADEFITEFANDLKSFADEADHIDRHQRTP